MKKALIIGGTSNLGEEIIKGLLKNSFEVYTTKREESKIADDLKNKVKIFNLNLKDKDSISKFYEKIKEEKFDFITNTISNKPTLNRFEKIEQETFESDMEINVLNYIFLLKKIIPNLNKNSNLIFILSEMTLNERLQFTSSYQVTKFALLGLMKALKNELKSKKIRVNAISPGMMETKFISHIPKIMKENYTNKYNNSKFINPSDVAKEIIKIINKDSINGENIGVFKK